jgi:hypothetical protein
LTPLAPFLQEIHRNIQNYRGVAYVERGIVVDDIERFTRLETQEPLWNLDALGCG